MTKQIFSLSFSKYGNYGRNYHYQIEVLSTSLEAAITSVEAEHPDWFFRGEWA